MQEDVNNVHQRHEVVKYGRAGGCLPHPGFVLIVGLKYLDMGGDVIVVLRREDGKIQREEKSYYRIGPKHNRRSPTGGVLQH